MSANERPAVTVGMTQEGLRGMTARIYDPDTDFVIDDNLVPAEFTDGSVAVHGQYVTIADDMPNIFGALTVHKPGQPENTVLLQHYQVAVAIPESGG